MSKYYILNNGEVCASFDDYFDALAEYLVCSDECENAKLVTVLADSDIDEGGQNVC